MVAVVLAIEICVELVFIREMTLPIPIIPIPSDRQIMAVPIFRSRFSANFAVLLHVYTEIQTTFFW